VQGFQPLDSGLRQNDGIRSKLRGIELIEINQSFERDNNHSSDVSLFFLQAIRLAGYMQGRGGTAALVPPCDFTPCVE